MTVESGGQLSTGTDLTLLTSSASANTKGSWVELIASTSNSNEWIGIAMASFTNDETFLIDIGVGAASSESVVVGDFKYWGNQQSADYIYLPRTIASGSRVSARCQAVGGSAQMRIGVNLHTGSDYGTSTSNISAGADTAASQGVVVDAGSSANTKGSYAEIDSSTSADMDWLVVKFGPNDNPTDTQSRFFVDIATGAAASEVVLIPNIFYRKDASEFHQCHSFHIKETIASGTRIAARCQSDITDATDRTIDVSVLGANMTAP